MCNLKNKSMQKSRIRIRALRGILIRKMLIFMKLFCLFQFVFFISVQANVYSQQAVVNVEMENVSLKAIFTELSMQAGCDFLYNNQMIQQKGLVSLKVQNKPLDQVLKEWLPSLGLTFSYDDNVVIIRAVKEEKKKVYTIEGKVVDENNVPMPGVTVLLDSTSFGTSTDTAGRFVLPLPREKGSLVFSFVGFKTKKVAYTAGKLVVVKMEEDISGLDEVQVVAYGSQKKRTVISQTTNRIKSAESIYAKLLKKGLEPDFETARKNLKDLIGIRVVCPFEDELYQVAESLEMQKDIEIVRIKDYIKNPKKNGYKSLHLIVKVPIYSAEGEQKELVEIQLRTIAMDYWSVLEYELYYKKRDNAEIEAELKKYAEEIANLDHRMLELRNKIEKI